MHLQAPSGGNAEELGKPKKGTERLIGRLGLCTGGAYVHAVSFAVASAHMEIASVSQAREEQLP